jgi:hypothetical protein
MAAFARTALITSLPNDLALQRRRAAPSAASAGWATVRSFMATESRFQSIETRKEFLMPSF